MDGARSIYWTRRCMTPYFSPENAGDPVVASEAKLLTVQFLKWVAERPRRYAELREAWSSTCPLNCAGTEATRDDVVGQGAGGCLMLTRGGGERLAAAGIEAAISPL